MNKLSETINRYENDEIENTALNIREVGHENFYGQKSWGPGNKNFYVIHYVLKGKGLFKINNKSFTMKKGDVFLICPEDNVFYTPDKYDPWEYLWVSFDGSLVKHFLTNMPFTKDKPYANYEEDLSNYINNIISNQGNTTKEKTKMLGHLYLFFSKLMTKNTTPQKRKTYFQTAYEYILSNFNDKDISVTQIAEEVNITRGHLYKIFKENLNLSPVEFITKCRIEESLLLLRCTDLPINEIASKTGFKDPYYFSNVFKKSVGTSPLIYRKEIQKNGL